jgi:hypothetical protein
MSYYQAMRDIRFKMPLSFRLVGFAIPAAAVVAGAAAQGLAGALIGAVLGAPFAIPFLGRTAVLKPEGIAYGKGFVAAKTLPWAEIREIEPTARDGVSGGQGWFILVILNDSRTIQLPAPYSVGDKPGRAFSADLNAVRGRWRSETETTKNHVREGRTRSAGQQHQ